MKTTYTAYDEQHFENEEDCREYERLLPVLYELIDRLDDNELGNDETESFLRDVKEHIHTSSLERYLFNQRKVFARIADLLNQSPK
jgi:hypothetical protein